MLLTLFVGTGSLFAQKGSGGGGGGNATTVSFTPSNYVVKPTGLGSASSLSIDLINTGSSPLTIKTTTIGGAQAADYALGGTCVNGAVIPRSGTCRYQITFTPQALGARTAVINATFVNANALNLPLNGQGLTAAPTINVSFEGPIVFPAKPTGSLASPTAPDAQITIVNVGAQGLSLNFGFAAANPTDFVQGRSFNPLGGCSQNEILPPLSQCNLGLDFLPTTVGSRSATLRITSNDPVRPNVDIALSGEGTPGATPPPPPPPPPPIVSDADFSDLWGSPGQTDWSLEITHHKATTDVLLAFWHTYDVDGRDMWVELKDGHWVDGLTYTGKVHRSRGAAFSAPDDPNLFIDSIVGTATLSFTDSANGTLTFTVNGTSGSKQITRVVF
jgi:hypothetical protein